MESVLNGVAPANCVSCLEHSFFFSLMIALLGVGCGGNADSAKSDITATSTAAASNVAAGSGCASVGCGDEEGDFFNKCNCKGKNMTPPLVAKYTGKLHSFYKTPTFEVKNTSDKPIQWASAKVYYYDNTGKQIEVTLKDQDKKFKNYATNGSTFALKAKETKEMAFGWKDNSHPKNAVKMEVVFDGWCYGSDKSTELCIIVDPAPEERSASN